MFDDFPRTPRTDLACESAPAESAEGVNIYSYEKSGYNVTVMRVENETGMIGTGKAPGTYYTVFTGEVRSISDEARNQLVTLLSDIIKTLITDITDKNSGVTDNLSILVAGLGNRHMTADAIGPLVSEKITVTRDLKYKNRELYDRLDCACVSTVAPGVAAETGIEVADLIRGACGAVHPDAVIAIDALAARSCSRLATTIQITDTGISPGSGIGNTHTPVNTESLGVPVITVGIPTIVDSSSLVYDALAEGGIDPANISDELRGVLENGRSFFVSPKDCDIIVEDMASLVSDAINRLCGF